MAIVAIVKWMGKAEGSDIAIIHRAVRSHARSDAPTHANKRKKRDGVKTNERMRGE